MEEKVSARNEKISTLVHGSSTISHNGSARPGSELDCRSGIPLSKREDLKQAFTAQNLEMPGAGAPLALTKKIQHVAVQQSQPFHVSQAQTITPPQPSSLPANIVPVHIVSDDGNVKIAAKKGRFTIIEAPIKKEQQAGLIATGIHVPVASKNQQLTQQQIVQLPSQQHAQHHGLAQKNDLLMIQAQSASIVTPQPQIVKVTSASIIEQPSHNGNGTLPNTLIQQGLPVQQQQVLNMQRSVEIGNVNRNDTITDPLIPVPERKGRFIVTKAADSNPALHVRANSFGATQDQINHLRTTNVQQKQTSRINNQLSINSGSHQMAPSRHGSDGHPTTSTSGGYMNKGLPPPVPKVPKVSAVDRINASVTSGGISKGGLSSAVPGGMGKMFHFLDQLKLEVVEADKMIKTLQNDVKFLRGKNKELEARCNESEIRYMEEKASREESDAKIRSLKKRLKEMKEQKETKSQVTMTSSATSIPMPPIMHHGESGVLITESQPFEFSMANGKKVEGRNKVSTTQEAQKRVPSKSQFVRGVGLKAVAATERSTSEPLLNLTSIGIGGTSTNGLSTSSPSEMPMEDAFSDLSASIENAFDSLATF
mmetsp:Transcript_16231/g.23778  ORF Transcript_16231/g.23778 Transcript_16231/m.23778 type:complete len:595 (+) Transcript_16231:108-1892(+)|eukprot:CAMPEP_0194087368 /NCGR_PEP_ID=MMETSP0149-20130528/24741_1 /TAXON_ID=122233 /ORGANISM="Chaetoceros debilis, Strain MM31A-1" /LENGTH=594 /DNA_ID=CAMNT_0038770699 /DNA_START=45 /DNA_END=1829 /DNA_ORIENTATION=-